MHRLDSFKASVIVSVYKDAEALCCVLYGLQRQTERNFEVIVAEDGEDHEVAKVCRLPWQLNLLHQTQADIGFRKMRAVNRAIAAARSAYVAFLDGDCIPHKTWLERHLTSKSPGAVLAGRRMHLGKAFSSQVRKNPDAVTALESFWKSWLLVPTLQVDGARNIEVMKPSAALHRFAGRKQLNLVGCNFSGFKNDLFKVNGYDEDLAGVGGEDDDLHWRLNGVGIRVLNVKFLAIVYHLFHLSRRQAATENVLQSLENIRKGLFFSRNGIAAHLHGDS